MLVTVMLIRGYQPSDAGALAAIFNRAVTITASSHYSPEQIAAWLGGGMEAEETHVRCSDGRLVVVAVNYNDIPIGFIDLEADGHVDMLFVDPDHGGRGVASALYAELESRAQALGLTRLYVEASELAHPVFAHFGFTLLHRRDFTLDGVPVHNHAMEKHLGSAPPSR